MERADGLTRIIPSWSNPDRHLIHPANQHLDEVVERLNLLMRGYELSRVRFNTTSADIPAQTSRVSLPSWPRVRLIHWLGTYSLVIPVDPDIALPLEGFDWDGGGWGTVEFEGADFVKIVRPIALPGRFGYEHDIFWRYRPKPA